MARSPKTFYIQAMIKLVGLLREAGDAGLDSIAYATRGSVCKRAAQNHLNDLVEAELAACVMGKNQQGHKCRRWILTADADRIDAYVAGLAASLPPPKPDNPKRPKKSTGKILAAMVGTYRFYAANPGATVQDLADEFSIPRGTARSRTIALLSRACLTTKTTFNYRNQVVESYTVVEGASPEGAERIADFDDPRHAPREFKRIFAKAAQVGMHRDPLVSAIFGAPAVAA